MDFAINLIDNYTYRISWHSISLTIRSILEGSEISANSSSLGQKHVSNWMFETNFRNNIYILYTAQSRRVVYGMYLWIFLWMHSWIIPLISKWVHGFFEVGIAQDLLVHQLADILSFAHQQEWIRWWKRGEWKPFDGYAIQQEPGEAASPWFFCWRFLDHTETWFGALWAYASRRWCELQLYPIKLHPFKLMFWNIFSCERTENVTAGRWKQLIKGQRPKIHIDRDTDAFLFRLFISEPAGREEAPVQSATCIQFNTSISVHFQWRLNGFTVSFTACECSFMLFADLRSLCWSYGCAVAHSAATAPPTKMRLGYMLHPWDVPHHQWCHFPHIHPRYNIIIHHL